VATSEAARADLYNGLAELLGSERAETLMTAVPGFDFAELVTKSDLGVLDARVNGLDQSLNAWMDGLGQSLNARMDGLDQSLNARMDGLDQSLNARIDGLEVRLANVETIVIGLGSRMDRMFFAMIAGLFVILATMAGVLISL
jgi:autonomous glycyl radical cofactor GrcA